MRIKQAIGAIALAASMAQGTTGALAQADNTNSQIAPADPRASDTRTWPGWMHEYSTTHQGRITRDAYFDEMGRRWDAADARRQGLSVAEINRVYGPANSDPVTGTVTAPGYMGPKDVSK